MVAGQAFNVEEGMPKRSWVITHIIWKIAAASTVRSVTVIPVGQGILVLVLSEQMVRHMDLHFAK